MLINEFLQFNYNDIVSKTIILHTSNEYKILINLIDTFIKEKFYLNNVELLKYEFNNDTLDFEKIVSILTTQSLFDNTNYINLTFDKQPTDKQYAQILDINQKLNSQDIIIINCHYNKKINSLWFKDLANSIHLTLNESNLYILIQYLFNKNKLSIDNSAIKYLIDINQTNINQLLQDINLSILYFVNKVDQINITHINQIVLNNSIYSIYNLSEAYLTGDLKLSIKILNSLDNLVLIHWILVEDLKKLIKIKSIINKGLTFKEATKMTTIFHPKSINNFQIANQRLTYKSLINIFDMLSVLDMIIKGISAKNPIQQIILIIKEICKTN